MESSAVLIPLVSQYLRSHKRLVVPQLGAFIVKEPERCVLFSELLKRDDGVLRALLTAAGMGDVEAAGEIDRFVFEVRHAVQHGREYRLEGFGVMRPGPNGTIAFDYDPQPAPAESAPAESASSVSDPAATGSEAAATSAPAESPAAAKQPSAATSSAGTTSAAASSAATLSAASSAAKNASSGPTLADGNAPAARSSAASTSAASNAPAAPQSAPQHAARQTYVEPRITPSAKLNPEPYVRGLRYGKPRKSTDAYRYVDAPPRRRRTDRFLLVALIAAAVALAAIAFGYYREARERRAEAEFIEQLQAPAVQPHANEPNPTE